MSLYVWERQKKKSENSKKIFEKIIFYIKKAGNPYKRVGGAIECIIRCFSDLRKLKSCTTGEGGGWARKYRAFGNKVFIFFVSREC